MDQQTPRFFAITQDLIFTGKIAAAAKRVGIEVVFANNESKFLEKAAGALAVLLLDLNNVNPEPLALIGSLKANEKLKVHIIGYISHVQKEREREAYKAGCDLVLPRSVFSQNLDEILRQNSCHFSTAAFGCPPNSSDNALN
ncbi:MAG: hypothetical protein A3F68_02480 [Acidobacteria bacterium RIFCSPLOWO2_12_FULL_54_10]|nr:MAG: hypothetical protein A3F68_02480 [Acidobacteria bacterium RIFCSPLOWO2_12_FULL_54_10]